MPERHPSLAVHDTTQDEVNDLAVVQPVRLGAGLTVPEAARRYRVGEDKIRSLIRQGELKAINMASVLCGKPRWVITPEALAEFERRRAGGPPPKKPRRRKRVQMEDYYPD